MSDILKMFGVVIKSLFKKPACEMYPVKPAKFYDRTRGQVAIDAPRCILCTLCDKKCPTGAITVDKSARTWTIDQGKCILCSLCVEACPKKCLWMEKQHAPCRTAHKADVVNIPE